MPYEYAGPSYYRREWLDNAMHTLQDSDTLASYGLSADARGDIWVEDGTVLDLIDTGGYSGFLKVRESGSTYTAKGILLSENINLRYGPKIVAYLTHGRVRENLVICEGTAGSVAAGVKTALSEIQWV